MARGIWPDVVVLPTATGGTQAGLLIGFALAGLPTHVAGIAVAHPAAELIETVATLLAQGADMTGADLATVSPIEIDDGQLGPAYGRPSVAGDEAARLLARSEGVLVDPIYTAKALAGLVAMARSGEVDGQTVVFWHAGGTTALFEPLGDAEPG